MTITPASANRVDDLYRAAAGEVHPGFCAGDPLGCAGTHVSAFTEVTARIGGVEVPLHVAGVLADGRFAVVVQADAADVEIELTAAQARRLAAVVAGTAALAHHRARGRPWSRPYGDVKAYGEALAATRGGAP